MTDRYADDDDGEEEERPKYPNIDDATPIDMTGMLVRGRAIYRALGFYGEHF